MRVDPGAQHDLGADHPDARHHAAHIEAASPSLAHEPGKVEIDAATREQLEELGYLPDDE